MLTTKQEVFTIHFLKSSINTSNESVVLW